MKVRRSLYDVFVEVVCLLCLIGGVIYLAGVWSSVPAQVPAHYNMTGAVDRMGSKSSVFIIVITNWLCYLLITVLECFPQCWNTCVTITEENRARIYRILKSMIGTTKLVCVVSFTYLTVKILQGQSLPFVFTLVLLGSLFGSLVFFIVRLVRAR